MRLTSLLYESGVFAVTSLIANKLRTFLSLLGIAIGIFAIISVYAIVDSLENNIRSSVASLGSDIVYVQKWPWGGGGGEYPWWKYFQRPETEYKELLQLQNRMERRSGLAGVMGNQGTVQYGNSSTENTQIRGVSEQYGSLWKLKIDRGRYFSETESRNGRPVCLLGATVAEGLFGNEDAMGREIKTLGRSFAVVGILEKEGSSMVGESHDEQVLVPIAYMRQLVNEQNAGTALMIQARPGQSTQELTSEIRGHMRAIRRLKPSAEDNFALNEASSLSAGLDAMFSVIGLAGTIIGGFSVAVGGFGIANIMFVSVRERTGQIGIQKALGARRSFILVQFLAESVLLSLFGGLVGLVLAFFLTLAAQTIGDFEVVLSGKNIVQGLGISGAIGLLAGIVPAYMAARLDPVEAIRVNS